MVMDQKIKVSNLHIRFGDRRVLDGVSFEHHQPGNIAILGPNGAGKSTFLKALCGLIPADKGQVLLLGMNPRSFGLRKRLGVCFQKVDFPAYVKVKSICKLIASQYGLKHWDHPGFYHLFGMHELTNLEANSLSGGEKKRLMLYLSYFHEPDLIILDEPTAALDSKYQNIFRDYLRSSKDQKRLTIMSSHMDEDLQSGIDVVLKLSRGKITKEIISKDSERSRNRHVIFDAVDGYPYHQHPEIELIGGKAHIHTDHAEDLFRKLSQANTPLPNLSVSRSKKPTSEVRP